MRDIKDNTVTILKSSLTERFFDKRSKGKSMKRLLNGNLLTAGIFLLPYAMPSTAMATQGHGGIEGVYVHQMAHLFFILSLCVLIYSLRTRKLIEEKGWRLIQYSALFFILWNMDAFLVHALDDQFGIIQVTRIETWQIQITDSFDLSPIRWLYYLAKLDHLLCVPALFFLYLGLKRLLNESVPEKVERQAQ